MLALNGEGRPESYAINLPKDPQQLLFQQLCPKTNPRGRPCSWPTPGSLWCLDLTQMVLANFLLSGVDPWSKSFPTVPQPCLYMAWNPLFFCTNAEFNIDIDLLSIYLCRRISVNLCSQTPPRRLLRSGHMIYRCTEVPPVLYH